MDKVVIFDWGGVVENHENDLKDLKNAKIRVIRRFNKTLSDDEILKRWTYKTEKGTSLSIINSEIEIRNWVSMINRNMNINVSFEEFKNAYEEEFSLIRYYKDVVEYAHSLKDRCKIAILSDLILFDKKRIDNQYDLSKFDKVYLSFEIGISKPDRRIYEYVLNDLKIPAENILFIDDDINNIITAKKCGWNTCEAFGYDLDKIKKSVDKFLLK